MIDYIQAHAYFLIKWVHILSATLLFGTGLGTAFHGFIAFISRDARVTAAVGRSVVLADWLFTTPAVFIQPISGFALIYLGGYSFFEGWIVWTYILYVLTGVCWLPVVWLQLRIRQLAEASLQQNTPMPPEVTQYIRIWFILGWPAFISVIAIFYLMVLKPEL